MQLICCLLLMAVLSPDVSAKLWKMEPKGGIKETEVPQMETAKEPDVPPMETAKEANVQPGETVKEANDPPGETVKEKPKENSSCPKPSGYEMTVLKQVIGKLLNQLKPVMIPGNSDEKVKYNMKMELSSLDLNKISLFLEKKGDIYDVEEVLTSMLGEVSSDEMLGSAYPQTFYEKYSLSSTIIVPIVFVLFLFLSLRFMYLPFWIFVKWISFLIFVVSVFWNWYFLYQQNYTKYQTAIEKGPPENCKDDYKAGFWDSISSAVSSVWYSPVDECQKYHMITSIHPGLWVPPTEAISICIVNTFLKPLASAGENIGLFFQKLSQQVPPALLIVVLVFILIVLLFIIIIVSGYSVGNFFIQLTPPSTPNGPSTIDDSKEIKEKLDRVMTILEKIPNIDDDIKEIRDVLQKSIRQSLENKPAIKSSGDGQGDQAEN